MQSLRVSSQPSQKLYSRDLTTNFLVYVFLEQLSTQNVEPLLIRNIAHRHKCGHQG